MWRLFLASSVLAVSLVGCSDNASPASPSSRLAPASPVPTFSNLGSCRAGMTVRPLESCAVTSVYVFKVMSDGRGCYPGDNSCASGGFSGSIGNVSFEAERISGTNNWRIEKCC